MAWESGWLFSGPHADLPSVHHSSGSKHSIQTAPAAENCLKNAGHRWKIGHSQPLLLCVHKRSFSSPNLGEILTLWL